MGSAVMGTLHGANRLLERDVPLEATIIGANLARHLLSEVPRKIWHAGVEIVAVLSSKGHPQILTAWNEELPDDVHLGLETVAPLLSEKPFQFRYKGYNVLAKKNNETLTAILVWKGERHGR